MSRVNFTRATAAFWSGLHPKVDLSGLEVVLRLIWSGRLAEELLEQAAIASGLRRRGDYEVLTTLRRAEPELLTPVQVAQQLRTSQSGMTGKLDRLERQGLIERIPDLEDRRALRLGVTHEGRALLDRAFATSLSQYQAMLEDFTPKELKEFQGLLERLLSRLDALAGYR